MHPKKTTTFVCPNCKHEIKGAIIPENGIVKCGFCGFENRFNEIELSCPKCNKKTKTWIPVGTQFCSVHYADTVFTNPRGEKIITEIDGEIYETLLLKNGGEIQDNCQNCGVCIHVEYREGKRILRNTHLLEKVAEYIPKKLGKPHHLHGIIPDRDFQRIAPPFFLFLVGFGLCYVVITSADSMGFAPTYESFGVYVISVVYALFLTASYHFLKKIKNLATVMEVNLSEDKNVTFYGTLQYIFKARWALVYALIIFGVFSIDNFGVGMAEKWFTDIFHLPTTLLGGIIAQIFVGYGILLYVLGGGPLYEQAFKVDFFKAKNMLRTASTLNYHIAITITILATVTVINNFYFWPQEVKELYGMNTLLALWMPLLIGVILLSFLGYSLLLQNLTNKIKEKTLKDIDEKISAILNGKEEISGKKDLIQTYFSIKNYLESNQIGMISKDTALQGMSMLMISSIPYFLDILKSI